MAPLSERSMDERDRVFWERLAEMPWLEAEQECISRREQLCIELAELQAAVSNFDRGSKPRDFVRVQAAIASQLTLLNERVKYLRKAQDSVHWARAVTAIYGQDGYVACRLWMEQQRSSYPSPGARA